MAWTEEFHTELTEMFKKCADIFIILYIAMKGHLASKLKSFVLLILTIKTALYLNYMFNIIYKVSESLPNHMPSEDPSVPIFTFYSVLEFCHYNLKRLETDQTSSCVVTVITI